MTSLEGKVALITGYVRGARRRGGEGVCRGGCFGVRDLRAMRSDGDGLPTCPRQVLVGNITSPAAVQGSCG